MLWVVAMLKTHVTRNAEIKIITGSASDKAFLGKLLNARIAGSGSNLLIVFFFLLCLNFNQCGLGLIVRDPWCESLSSAGDDFAVLDETFNHPVTIATT